MKDKIVIYHKNCMDGTAGAWCAYQKFGDSAEYIPCSDRVNLPENLNSDLSNIEIYIIDFSYTKEVLLDLEKKCKKLVILDHHISAKEAVESIKEHVFKLDESGAKIAWKYFFPDETVPKIIEYVSDSDIWAHKLPDWEAVAAYIYSFGEVINVDLFSELRKKIENDFVSFVNLGKELLRVRNISIDYYVNKAELIEFEGYKIYAVNAQKEFRSEVGHILAQKTNSFAMVYYYEEGKWKISLRGVESVDVSKIAEKYGGGGHKNAAAFLFEAKFPINFKDSLKHE